MPVGRSASEAGLSRASGASYRSERSYRSGASQQSYRSRSERSCRSGASQQSYRSGMSQGSRASRGGDEMSYASQSDHGSARSRSKASATAPVSPTATGAPPGYSGYIPGVYAGNVFGHTFARANKHASNDLDAYRSGSLPKSDAPARRTKPGAHHPGYSYGAQVPGYAGFVPGAYAGNLIGTCIPRAAKTDWCPLQDGPRPTGQKK